MKLFQIIKILLIVFTLCSTHLFCFSQTPTLTENSKVSLLTSSPSDEAIYTIFGHNGLRIKDDSLNIDYVFDYGIFDFSSDNFIFRFVKGETDYMVKARPYVNFIFEYNFRGVGVREQIINLSLPEKQNVFDFLINNALPENRVYRYNFFYDNCATRPRDIITQNIDGTVKYETFTDEQTYRDLLEESLAMTPWSRFGINIVIGSQADKVITERQKDFLPAYLYNSFTNAQIQKQDNSLIPLVVNDNLILQSRDGALALQKAKDNNQKANNYPLYIGLLILSLAVVISYLSLIKHCVRISLVFDTLLFFVAGIIGCIIFFLTFYSEHPCVDANWNMVWLNPLALLIIPFFFAKSLTKYVISYHFVNFVALVLFLLGFAFIPQKLEIAFIPYILALCIRSGANLWKCKLIK